MNGTLILEDGEPWDKLTEICAIYGISIGTVHNWRRKGWLGKPMLIGNTNFYRRNILRRHFTIQNQE